MKRTLFGRLSGLLGCVSALLMTNPPSGVGIGVGDIAPDFTVPNRKTGAAIHLHDYAGSVVVLEFFVWWCPHCQAATPQIKKEIHDYYTAANYPVKNLYINEESIEPSETDDFIRRYGIGPVASDTSHVLFNQLGGAAYPHFVVINGITNTPAAAPWQILFLDSGFGSGLTVPLLRQAIAPVLPPKLSIVSPVQGTVTPQPFLTVTGKAKDEWGRTSGVAQVEFQLENASGTTAYQMASSNNGWTNWSATLSNLYAGTNIIRVRATDADGNASLVERAIFYKAISPLKVAVTGSGRVALNLTNTLQTNLIVGKTYTLTAIPGKGSLFSNWLSGFDEPLSALSRSARVSFLMQTGLCLQANFVSNPFLTTRGQYTGLFYNLTNGVHPETSGFFSLALDGLGSYSGHVLHDGERLACSGRFDLDGKATNVVSCGCGEDIYFDWTLNLSGSATQQINAVVLHHEQHNFLLGDRAPQYGSRVSPYRGRYTFVLPGNSEATNEPGGDSYAAVTVARDGRLTLSGVLADGKPITQSVPVSTNGVWPLYAALDGGTGTLLSWVTLTNSPPPAPNLLSERVSWIKAFSFIRMPYSNGFALETNLIGSTYRWAKPVLPFSTGLVTFAGVNLPDSFTNIVRLTTGNKVINNPGQSPLSLTINTNNGLFTGAATVPGTTNKITFKGALLQWQNEGSGFFLRSNQSGRVFFGPLPGP
jgi:peroxiredoxin